MLFVDRIIRIVLALNLMNIDVHFNLTREDGGFTKEQWWTVNLTCQMVGSSYVLQTIWRARLVDSIEVHVICYCT